MKWSDPRNLLGLSRMVLIKGTLLDILLNFNVLRILQNYLTSAVGDRDKLRGIRSENNLKIRNSEILSVPPNFAPLLLYITTVL